MAITKITRDALNTGIDDNSDATAITIDSSEKVAIGTTSTAAGQVTIQGSGNPRQLVITDDGAEKLQIFQIGNDATIEAGSGGSESTNLIFKTASSGSEAERMRIDGSGRVTIPNQPAFFGFKSGGGNSTAASGAGVIDTVGTDVGNNFNTSNGRFTCPVAGRYLVTWTIMNSQNNTGTPTAKFRHNSTPYKYFHVENSHPQGQSDQVIVNASANDFFDLDVSHFHFNGGSQFKYPSMCVMLIG